MKYRKIMTAIASMTMAGVMLAGCASNSTSGTSSTDSGSAAGNSTASSGGSESTAGSEKVSLTVWGPQEDQELIKKMCDEFALQIPKRPTPSPTALSARQTLRRKLTRTSRRRLTYSLSLRTRPLYW